MESMMNPLETVLENIFGDFLSVLTGGAKNRIEKDKIKHAFFRCGDILSRFENTGEDSFGDAVQAVFSRENLQMIYTEMSKETGYDMIPCIRRDLERICKEYDVEAEHFIDAFMEMFKRCIYENDRALYAEIYQSEWRAEEHDEHRSLLAYQSLLLSKVNGIEAQLNRALSAEENMSSISYSDAEQNWSDGEAGEDQQEWKLRYPQGKGLYLDEEKKRARILELTQQWKEERQKAPQWYIVPGNKRRTLRYYTCDEELLYLTESVSTDEKFDFAYELVWRYEAGFISYTAELLKEIRKVWDQINYETEADPQKQETWFYMGQALLREYREDLDLDNWNEVYARLWSARSGAITREDDLSLQKIKLLFMQNKISETRDALLTFRGRESAFGVRLQAAGLKAECGLLSEACQDLQELEKGLLSVLQADTDKKYHVYYKSVLSGAYFLQAFIIQAGRLSEDDAELKGIWAKEEKYESYFSFDRNKNEFIQELYRDLKKEKESEPFEVDRVKKTVVFASHRFSGVYDFFRLLDRSAVPLHIGYTRLLDEDESDFIRILLEKYRYIGWFMLLRFGSIKTTEIVLGRKECIVLNRNNREGLEKAFDYVYDAVDRAVTGIQTTNGRLQGNAYNHILSNGLEILRRMLSVTNIRGQKKLINLMCKLMDADVVQEYQVLNKWIRQIMYVTEDRVKAAMLNELLTCSAKERTQGRRENSLDPFDVFNEFMDARHFYQSADIDPDIIDDMLNRAYQNEKEKRSFIPRLGQMADWNLLTEKQRERFAVLLWGDITEQTLLPYENDYFVDTFLRWPHPEKIDVAERIKRKLLDTDNFKYVKKQRLSAIAFGENIYLKQIRYLNRSVPDFWKTEEVELLVKGILDCWKALKQKFSEARDPELYREEFSSRVKSLLSAICSFDRKLIQQIDKAIIECVQQMAHEINEYGLETIELVVLFTPPDRLSEIEGRIITGLRAADREKVVPSVNAALKILYDCYQTNYGDDLFKEMAILCLYRKEPGLECCLIAIHNLLYSVKDIELAQDNLDILYEVLDNIDQQTDYENNLDKTEKAMKNLIKIREACAAMAYQLYRYEERNYIPHSSAVSNWKDICKGGKSLKEFVEVKRHWFE